MKNIIILGLLFIINVSGITQCTKKTKSEWENYFKNEIDRLDPIEGIWSVETSMKVYDRNGKLIYPQNANHESLILRKGNDFLECPLGDEVSSPVTYAKTAINNIYNRKSTDYETRTTVVCNAKLTGNAYLEYTFDDTKDFMEDMEKKGFNYKGEKCYFERKCIKLYPINEVYQNTDKEKILKESKVSGTGFAISSNGYIVTNHHVTNGSGIIKVKGINGDFAKIYNAKIVTEDRNNDLSIIKIDDPTFNSLGVIPYVISGQSIDVGIDVFVLGYPLRSSMGDEVKLTNGIISSKSGYQGDITSYQITAPIQPGNSGGPLFDNNGNIIGIVNAKHIGAENASYGIKASYLLNLIDAIPNPPKLQTISILNGKQLSDQVKIIKTFTYIIEVN